VILVESSANIQVKLTVEEENCGVVAASLSLNDVLVMSWDGCASSDSSATIERSAQNFTNLAIGDDLLNDLDDRSRLALRSEHGLDTLLVGLADQLSDLVHVGCQWQFGVNILASCDNRLQQLVVSFNTDDTDNQVDILVLGQILCRVIGLNISRKLVVLDRLLCAINRRVTQSGNLVVSLALLGLEVGKMCCASPAGGLGAGRKTDDTDTNGRHDVEVRFEDDFDRK
jgi:hypothetical protein